MDNAKKNQAQISALRLLAASPKSRKELAGKLADKGYPEETVRETLDQLEKQGLQSDRAFAQNLLERWTYAQPSGRRKIDFELKRRGIASAIREELLSSIAPEDERARARELASARWERLTKLPAEKRTQRVYEFLIRRGFDFQICRDLVEQLESRHPQES